ncbi:host specificity protein J [Pandoraea pneumonica]|uniref:Host specificity protein J n=1 Tax=Pandoraea pneumonica TaxID=2508299 RepID=A0A5E4WUT3_9BURK|nr:phage tail protein [Pandoraea pneumonica]VVE28043.1 host specificity protein J [Pandoraea pneumonica]
MNALMGFKAESEVRQPVESPDSLHSVATAKVLDIVSEGEIYGFVDGLRSVFVNETPLQNADGSFNFQGATVDFRPGTQDQTYIAGLPSVDNETYVGVELKFGQHWTQAINNLSLSAVRVRLSAAGLMQQLDNGDRVGWRVEYSIQLSTDGSPFVDVLNEAFDGKTTQKYERTRRIDLPHAKLGWTVRVVRKTPQPTSDTISGKTVVEAYTEVIDAKLRYPMSALAFVTLPAAQFSGSIPKRAYEIYGRIVAVPDNYDPWTRQYTGAWGGAFKLAWTNNPAWVFRDLVLSRRYGLGRYISADQLDKWDLYTIARYCDEMVPDGRGGMEPRFTCNVYLQKRAQARKVIQDLASLFRGIAYMAGGTVFVSADMPKDPGYVYNAANVIDGKFRYAGTPRKTRFTAALVSWSDQTDFGRQKVEYVEDPDGIQRYGLQITEVVAFGCTSQGQAQRLGQWLLLSSRLERGTVTFEVALEGLRSLPGEVVRVYDRVRARRMNDGRVSQSSGRSVTLDREPYASAGDTITINMPSGQSATRTIELISDRVVTVTQDWPEEVAKQAAWVIETSDLTAPLYRVRLVKEKRAGDKLTFEVTAVQYEPGKFEAVDHGTRIDPRPTVVVPPSVQPPPDSVTVSAYHVINQGIAITTMVGEWPSVKNAVQYSVAWRRDNGDWVSMPTTGSTSAEVQGIYAGTYVMRVRAINALGVMSAATYSVATLLEGKTTPPPVVTALSASPLVMGIALAWGFPPGPLDIERTEIWYSLTANVGAAIKLGDFAYPHNSTSLMGLAHGQKFYFWARLVDRSGNVGDFYPSVGGVLGSTDVNPGNILDYIKGEVDESIIGKKLAERIDLIDGPPELPGSVNARVRGVQSEVEGLSSALVDEHEQRVTALDAMAQKVDGVYAQFNPPMAGSTTFNAGSTLVLAGVWSQQAAWASEDMAAAKRIDSVQASVGDVAALANREASASVERDRVISTQVDLVKASVGDTNALVTREASASLERDKAITKQVDAMQSSFENVDARLIEESQTRAQQNDALATKLDGVYATLNPPMAGSTSFNAGSTKVFAGVWSQQSAWAAENMAVARRVDNVQASLGETSAAIQDLSEAQVSLDGKISASRVVQVNVTADGIPYAAGFSVGIDNSNGKPTSRFGVQADQFFVLNVVNGKVSIPFAIQNGDTVINSALIGKATLGSGVFVEWLESDARNALGQPLLRLNFRTGQMEFNPMNAEGRRLKIDSNGVTLFFPNGNINAQFGWWDA